MFGITQYPTPVFNTSDLVFCFGGNDGDTLPIDKKGLMRTLETVLFPGTKVSLIEQVASSHIWKIETEEYSYEGQFYIDDRFIKKITEHPHSRKIDVPAVPVILKQLTQLQGTPYTWGGNWPEGISSLHDYYPSKKGLENLDPITKKTWQIQGVDCSGLLHFVTNGYTPRNTSSLVTYGNPVDIEGKQVSEILETVQNLDLIVGKVNGVGHVIIVLDKERTIESLLGKGVVIYNAEKRLSEIMKHYKPVNSWGSTQDPHFVVRRWHPNQL